MLKRCVIFQLVSRHIPSRMVITKRFVIAFSFKSWLIVIVWVLSYLHINGHLTKQHNAVAHPKHFSRQPIIAIVGFSTVHVLKFFSMDLNYFIDLERGPRLQVIQWLQARYLLPNPLQCAQCNRAMDFTERNDDHVDGYLWWVKFTLLCYRTTCVSMPVFALISALLWMYTLMIEK